MVPVVAVSLWLARDLFEGVGAVFRGWIAGDVAMWGVGGCVADSGGRGGGAGAGEAGFGGGVWWEGVAARVHWSGVDFFVRVEDGF